MFKVSKDPPKLKSTLSASNSLYAGLPNPLFFTDSTLSADSYYIKVVSPNNRLWITHKDKNIEISAAADLINDTATIFICRITPRDTIILSTQKFYIARIPDPVLAVGYKPLKETITKAQLLKYKKLVTYMSNDLINGNSWFNCISFDMVVGASTLRSFSANLTPEMIQYIKQMASGTYIVFDNIQVLGPDGRTRTLQGWSGQVK